MSSHFWSALRRRRDDRPARVIMIDETGHRMEFVHRGRPDATGWTFKGQGTISGYLAVADRVEKFLRARDYDD